MRQASDCDYCQWTNLYMSCQYGSREYALYQHMRDEHPEVER